MFKFKVPSIVQNETITNAKKSDNLQQQNFLYIPIQSVKYIEKEISLISFHLFLLSLSFLYS